MGRFHHDSPDITQFFRSPFSQCRNGLKLTSDLAAEAIALLGTFSSGSPFS